MTCKTSVVIPYYQEEPGILRGAVLSAIAQEGVNDLEIIVVDDGSPAPARGDLKSLDLPAHVTLKLIEQPNRGPGAARNRALDSMNSDTVYVAFLDSDDRWTKDHICRAHDILSHGYDLYFADLWLTSCNQSFFARQGMQVNHHMCLDHGTCLYQLLGDARFDLIGCRNVFHTSTVMYRHQICRTLRFPECFFVGEDRTFWMGLLSYTDKVAFSCNIECVSGWGVHIYENSGWDTPKAIWRLHEYIKWRKWLGRTLLKDGCELEENKRRIRDIRRGFAISLLHEIRNTTAFRNANIVRFLKTDPVAVLYLGPVAVREIIKKIGL